MKGNTKIKNRSHLENDDSDSTTTDQNGWGAGYQEVFSSQGDEGLEHRYIQPDGDDYQETQYGGMANPIGGSGMGGLEKTQNLLDQRWLTLYTGHRECGDLCYF